MPLASQILATWRPTELVLVIHTQDQVPTSYSLPCPDSHQEPGRSFHHVNATTHALVRRNTKIYPMSVLHPNVTSNHANGTATRSKQHL